MVEEKSAEFEGQKVSTSFRLKGEIDCGPEDMSWTLLSEPPIDSHRNIFYFTIGNN
jgi:hypothetical protein